MSNELTDAVERIVRKISDNGTNGDNTIERAKARGARPASESSAVEAAPASKGGGISSPLTETAYADRLFFDDVDIPSSDGIFVIRLKQIKQMKFTDASAASVVFDYKDRP